MSLKQALLEAISEQYIYENKFSMVHVHESLAEAIRNNGEEFPNELDLSLFNQESGLPVVKIVEEKLDNLISYSFGD
ncbi:hypothetical protein [Niallia sp. FSL M8-0099]|uniref:hypothetical protein n=1 Tax=Niallia sp. FSL M8-0099 TaxID=2954519 RepID=UPI0030FB08DB